MPKEMCAHPKCSKKVNHVEILMGKCRCDNVYCSKHRMSEAHHCEFVFKINKEDFINANKCVAAKI